MPLQFLSAPQCSLWLREHRIPTSDDGRPAPAAGFDHGLRIWLPSDAARRIAFSRWIWRMVTEEHGTLVWFTDWSVWESSEHMPMAMALRRGLGTAAPLQDAPGCVVEPTDTGDGMSLFLLARTCPESCGKRKMA